MRQIHVVGEPYFAAYSFEAHPQALAEQSRALAEKAFGVREKTLLEAVIRRRYPHWQEAEKEELTRRAGEWIAGDILACPLFAGPRRLGLCSKALARRLQNADGPFSLDGFCRFAFPHYQSYLRVSVAEAAALWQDEREQAAYIALLRRRLAQTPCRCREIHLRLEGGVYHLYYEEDGRRRPLEGGPLRGFEDMLLGALLQLAPERLFVHSTDGQGRALTRALTEIFAGRIILCRHDP
ncbi:MAG: putative sporulation protein YtxC [Firmicutes bacterium]|nr:putative sporulation protein YtxC [Bacillota bacterium]